VEEDEAITTPSAPGSSHLHDKMNLSFAGCGFLAIYHLGVAQALAKYGRNFLRNTKCFAGASAGSLVASVLAIRGDDLKTLQESTQFCYDLAQNIRVRKLGVLTPGIDLLQPVEQFLTRMMPENAHELANGRLFVSVTDSHTKRNEIVSTFSSKQELIQYLLASSYIPVLTGSKPVFINGKKYYDGGMTDNLPMFTEGRTVRVSPFDGCQEISPRDFHNRRWYTSIHNQSFRVSLQNIVRGIHTFVPPSRQVLEAYHQRAMRDTFRFLQEEGYLDPGVKVSDPHLGLMKHTTDAKDNAPHAE